MDRDMGGGVVMLLTPKQAAVELGVSTAQLTRLTIDGELPSINIGRGVKRPSRRYDPADIEAFKAVRRTIECRSTSARAPRPISMTSTSNVEDLQHWMPMPAPPKSYPLLR